MMCFKLRRKECLLWLQCLLRSLLSTKALGPSSQENLRANQRQILTNASHYTYSCKALYDTHLEMPRGYEISMIMFQQTL
jgi:hypothetical protein